MSQFQILNFQEISNLESLVILRQGDTALFNGDQDSIPSWDLFKKQIELTHSRGLKGIETFNLDAEHYLVNLDDSKGLDNSERLRQTASKAYKHAIARKSTGISIPLSQISSDDLSALLDGLFFAQYRFTRYKSKSDESKDIPIKLFVPQSEINSVNQLISQKQGLFNSIRWTRDLVNTPGGDLVPNQYAQEIAQRLGNIKHLSIKILDEKDLLAQGFMGLITVGRGSQNHPRMVIIEYTPPHAKSGTHLGLVGKGMTFDAGGISIKPAAGMWEMRMDMAGSAAVVGAIETIALNQIPLRTTAVLCLAENRPGENAVLPGDIFTAKNGKTVMVDNTDAEGRLVLSDGLWQAGASGATTILDLATLTGAIIRAIGSSITGLFCNNDELAQKIIEAGRTQGEKLWQLPLDAEYRDSIDDKVADLKNIGGDAGAITAGLFLQEFIPEKSKWAHLDIAGTAFTSKDWKYYGWGATGWGVRTLVQLAQKLSEDQA